MSISRFFHTLHGQMADVSPNRVNPLHRFYGQKGKVSQLALCWLSELTQDPSKERTERTFGSPYSYIPEDFLDGSCWGCSDLDSSSH
jgi:hypothetical protein